MRDRVIIRPGPRGFGVIDPATGGPADTDHLAQRLAAPGRDGERATVQSLSWP